MGDVNVSLSDSLSLSDGLIQGFVKSLSDAMALSDSFQTPEMDVPLEEQLSLSEQFTIELTLDTLADSLSISEALTRAYGKEVGDSITMTDAFRRSHIYRQAH